MGNADNSKLIRIFGVTLADTKFIVRPYGHGLNDFEVDNKKVRVQYVDYFIEDLVALIKQQGLQKKFIKELQGGA